MKKILVCLLIVVLVVAFLGCAPKTGEAKIKLPKELGEPKDGVYYLSEDWYGKTINLRDCVKVKAANVE